MSLVAVRNAICEYFGGPYDPTQRLYLTPQVQGLGAVRRARGKRTNLRELHLHDGVGTEVHGTTMLVHLQTGLERRIAVAGPTDGIKQVDLEVNLHVFLHSTAEYAEDAEDAFVALADAIRDRIHADRTLGTGGFEAGTAAGVQVGEGDGSIRWEMDPPINEGRVTRGYLIFGLDAHQHIHA